MERKGREDDSEQGNGYEGKGKGNRKQGSGG